MKTAISFGLLLFLLGTAFVRLKPIDKERAHHPLSFTENSKLAGGVERLADVNFEDLHNLILSEPRTRVLNGDLKEGRITYVTRSRLWGFPDLTTVQADLDSETAPLQIYARLVFGKSDLGVNSTRVERWLSHLNTRDY